VAPSYNNRGAGEMGRTFKHDKDGGYTEAEVRGAMSVGRRFEANSETKSKKKWDKKFREQRKRREVEE